MWIVWWAGGWNGKDARCVCKDWSMPICVFQGYLVRTVTHAFQTFLSFKIWYVFTVAARPHELIWSCRSLTFFKGEYEMIKYFETHNSSFHCYEMDLDQVSSLWRNNLVQFECSEPGGVVQDPSYCLSIVTCHIT